METAPTRQEPSHPADRRHPGLPDPDHRSPHLRRSVPRPASPLPAPASMGYTLPPPSAASSQSASDPLAHAHSLIARKSALEADLDAQFAILRSHNIGMNTPLVDSAGFPRADIDIVAVRSARVRVIELRNDLNAILDDVKSALEAVHAANAANSRQAPEEERRPEDKEQDASTATTPFSRVDAVAPGSPAASAGLQREDLILAFGSFTIASLPPSASSSSSPSLAPLATLASSHEDRPLSLKVLRASETEPVTLTLIPRKWGGRGLIGCHIVPYTTPS